MFLRQEQRLSGSQKNGRLSEKSMVTENEIEHSCSDL